MGCIFLLNVADLDAGCAGDCFRCHEKLKNDETHVSLGSCISCHNPTEKRINILKFNDTDGCGNKCFDCHKEWPKNGYHAPLDKCLNCHQGKK